MRRPVVTIGGQTFTLAARGLHQAETRSVRGPSARRSASIPPTSASALEHFTLPGGRGELMQVGRLTILNDCYNANPQSFRSAIETARALRDKRRLVFLAGTMRELGSEGSDATR